MGLRKATAPVWSAIPFSAANFTAQAGNWTVGAADVKAFQYALIGKLALLQLTLNAGATSAIATDLMVTLPAVIKPAREFRGFLLTNNGGNSEAGFYYFAANVPTMYLRRIAGNWGISAAFQLALELTLEVA